MIEATRAYIQYVEEPKTSQRRWGFDLELVLLNRGWVAQVFSAVGLSAASEAVEFRIAAYLCNFLMQSITSQHTEMAVVIGAAAACGVSGHDYSP